MDSAVDPMEFALVLRDVVNIEQAVDVSSDSLSFLAYKPEPNPLFPLQGCDSSNVDTVLVTTQACTLGKSVEGDTTTTATLEPLTNNFQMSEKEMQGYPYHYAVRYSDCDLEQFLELVQYIDEDDGEINETLTLYVSSTASKLASWETIEATALIYASYLGYIGIVKWFLGRSDVVPTEKKFSTINRARSRPNFSTDVWTKPPAGCV